MKRKEPKVRSISLKSDTTRFHRVERRLKQYNRHILVGIIAVSLLIRAGYFLELNHGPLVQQHRWTATDMYFFDQWAQVIADGDWLTDRALHPYVDWHRTAAEAHFTLHPEKRAAFQEEGEEKDDPGRLLWNAWYGEKTFHQEPLYPYLIALTYTVIDRDVRWVFAWQLLLGVLNTMLIYQLACRFFGVVSGIAAALCALLCGPLLMYDMVLLRASLISCAGLTLIYLVDRAQQQESRRWWFVTGMACGMALLLKMTFLLFCLGTMVVLVYHMRHSPKAAAGFIGIMMAGMLLSLSPAIIRNLTVGVSPLSLSSVGAVTYIHANGPESNPETGLYANTTYVPRIMGETDGRMLDTVVATLRTYNSPWPVLAMVWKKFAALWQWYEFPNNTNFYYYRLHSILLRILPVTFGILGPLGILGLALATFRFNRVWPVYMMAAMHIAVMLGFMVLARYRIPLMILLVLFAGFTTARIVEWLMSRQWLQIGAATVCVTVLTLWTSRALPEVLPLIRPADYIAPYYTYYNPLKQEAFRWKNWFRAADIIRESLAYEPPKVRGLNQYNPVRNDNEHRLASWYAQVYLDYAEALRESGDESGSRIQALRAAELIKASGR